MAALTEVGLPPLGPVGWARWAWRQLTSMRTALLLLMLLAVAAVPGSVFPQRRVDASRVQAYLADHPTAGPWLDRLGAFDVYASPWFSAIYLLLFVSLVGCVVGRARRHVGTWLAAPPRTPRRLERMPAHATRTLAGSPGDALAAGRTHLRRRRFRLAEYAAAPEARATEGDGEAREVAASLSAERGYLAEVGNLVFHLALLAVLVAVAVGSLFSWSGQAVVVEGTGFADTLSQYDTFRPGSRVDVSRLPAFTLSLDRLTVRYDDQPGGQLGAPRDFDAALTVRSSPAATPEHRRLRVNHPLDIDGARVFLIGNGYAPVITVRDGTGQVVLSGPVPFRPRDGFATSTGVVKAYDAVPRPVGLQGFFLPTFFFDPQRGPVSVFPDTRQPRLVLTAFVGDMGINDGTPQSVYELDTSRMSQLKGADGPLRILLAPGQSATLPDGAGSVTFDGVRRYAALDIHHDPSRGWALGAAVSALLGLMLSLFVRRRRLWLRVYTDAEGRTVAEAAGLSRTQDDGLPEEVEALLNALGEAAPVADLAQVDGVAEVEHDDVVDADAELDEVADGGEAPSPQLVRE